jgi:hypothetical protein
MLFAVAVFRAASLFMQSVTKLKNNEKNDWGTNETALAYLGKGVRGEGRRYR